MKRCQGQRFLRDAGEYVCLDVGGTPRGDWCGRMPRGSKVCDGTPSIHMVSGGTPYGIRVCSRTRSEPIVCGETTSELIVCGMMWRGVGSTAGRCTKTERAA